MKSLLTGIVRALRRVNGPVALAARNLAGALLALILALALAQIVSRGVFHHSLDWAEELIGAHFAIRNPQAVSACGCGTSFSVG